MITIRPATHADAEGIRGVHLAAFPAGEGDRIARLAVDLLMEGGDPLGLSLVAEVDGTVAGHVAFSAVAADGNPDFHGLILAPLAVMPDHQKHGIGSTLVRDGIRRLSETDASILFVYGDPDYYGRFGFHADVAEAFRPPYELQYPFGWQALSLRERNIETLQTNLLCVDGLCDPALW